MRKTFPFHCRLLVACAVISCTPGDDERCGDDGKYYFTGENCLLVEDTDVDPQDSEHSGADSEPGDAGPYAARYRRAHRP